MPDTPNRGMTPRETARFLRVRLDRVRAWIRSGELGAVNMAESRVGKPRFVILPHHLAAWEVARRAAQPAPKKRQRQKQTVGTDYYPD